MNGNPHNSAFPKGADDDGGMSLRDWFASQALTLVIHDFDRREVTNVSPLIVARCAYEIADAMLLVRQEEKQG